MHSNLHAVYWIFTTIQSRIGTGMINAHTGGYCAGLLGPHNKSPYYECNYILTKKENQIKNQPPCPGADNPPIKKIPRFGGFLSYSHAPYDFATE